VFQIAKIHGHHLLPQEAKFAKYWKEVGIDIEKYVLPLPEKLHIRKPNGVHTNLGGNWNKEWDQFFRGQKGPVSKEAILGQLNSMMQARGWR